jgi:hypothetical protein
MSVIFFFGIGSVSQRRLLRRAGCHQVFGADDGQQVARLDHDEGEPEWRRRSLDQLREDGRREHAGQGD